MSRQVELKIASCTFISRLVWLVPMHINPVSCDWSIKFNVEFVIMWHWPAKATNWFMVTHQELHLMLETRALETLQLSTCGFCHEVLQSWVLLKFFFHSFFFHCINLHKHFDYWFSWHESLKHFSSLNNFFIIIIFNPYMGEAFLCNPF